MVGVIVGIMVSGRVIGGASLVVPSGFVMLHRGGSVAQLADDEGADFKGVGVVGGGSRDTKVVVFGVVNLGGS
jgi:hypothetical protein